MPCSSPAYAAAHGIRQHPTDLKLHNCLVLLRASSPLDAWRFSEGGNPLVVHVHGNRQTNDGGTLRSWALQGLGIALKSVLEIAADLKEERLIALLDAYTQETQGLH